METHYLDHLHREISLEEEDIQTVPESGRADEACSAIADKAYIRKQFHDVPFTELKKAAQVLCDNPEIHSRKDALMFFIWSAALSIKEERYEHNRERETKGTKTCADGFVWLLVSHGQARKLWEADAISLYRLYGDDSESLIETEEYLEETIKEDYRIGIEVGYVSQLAVTVRMK